MADGIRIKVEGLAELEARLKKLDQELAAKALVSSAFTANKIMADEIKAQIEAEGLVDTGALKNSITRKKIVYAKDGKLVVVTGVNKNAKGVDRKGKPRIPWRVANIWEGRRHFLAKAYEAAKQRVVDRFVEALRTRIARAERG